MGRYNKGVIFTNSNCIACNRCTNYCTVAGANVFATVNDSKVILVDSRKCIECGRCIPICSHNARDYKDDIDDFLADVSSGEHISAIISYAVAMTFGPEKTAQFIGYLRSIGVEHIYEESFGSEISLYCHDVYLQEHSNSEKSKRAFLINSCPSFVSNIEMYHPELIKMLIPVQTAAVCMAVYARNYLNDSNRMMYLGTCISNRRTFKEGSESGRIDYNVTIKHFLESLKNVDFSQFSGEAELKGGPLGKLMSIDKGFVQTIALLHERTSDIYTIYDRGDGGVDLIKALDVNEETIPPLAAECKLCEGGCVGGAGNVVNGKRNREIYCEASILRQQIMDEYFSKEPYEVTKEKLFDHFKNIDTTLFERKYEELFHQPFRVPESTYDEIYDAMLKDTFEKRNINCGSCGYKTCHEMAKAIAYGYNRKENCIHYMNDMVNQKAMYDTTTGLYNLNVFISKVQETLKKVPERKFSIVYADVNRLKLVNDIYGFETGDRLLRSFAQMASSGVGQYGCTAYLGAGQYILFDEKDSPALMPKRMMEAFRFEDLGIKHSITVKFGIYNIEDNTEAVRKMIDFAEMAAKEKQSTTMNTYTFFAETTREKILSESDISSKMRYGIGEKEFCIYYQPQFSTTDGKIAGAEALCRWIRKDGTMIMPGAFIPIAERSGFIKYIDREVWRIAFKTIRKWLDSDITPPPVSLNISRVSLEDDEFISYLVSLREEFRIENKYIHFEVTESICNEDHVDILERISKLRKLGFKIAMDDFGSGYSSLNALKDMPIDILKLDMGFLISGTNMERGGKILNAVARMAQDLEIQTIAEGVENTGAADFLKSIGINIIQGYVYSKPLPEYDYLKMLKNSEFSVNDGNLAKAYGDIETGKLLNPTSYENMFFEQFSGSALIVEFNDKSRTIELIRSNNKALSMLGLDDKSVNECQQIFKRFLSSEINGRLVDAVEEAVETNREITEALSLRDQKYRNELWVSADIKAINHNSNRHIVFVTLRNITSERIAKSMTTLSNDQISYLLGSKPAGALVLHIEPNGRLTSVVTAASAMRIRVLDVNEKFTALCGFSKDDVLRWNEKDIAKMVHPLDRGGVLKDCMNKLMSEKENAFEFDYRGLCKAGYYKRLKAIFSSVKCDDGSYIAEGSFISSDDD